MSNSSVLAKVMIFEGFDEKELEAVEAIAKPKEVIAGEPIFTDGSEAHSMFIIRSGSVDILKQDQKVATLGTGSHFGEMAFLDQAPRVATAQARESSLLLEISFQDLEALLAKQPSIGQKLYRTLARALARRIRQTTMDLSNLRELKLRHV